MPRHPDPFSKLVTDLDAYVQHEIEEGRSTETIDPEVIAALGVAPARASANASASTRRQPTATEAGSNDASATVDTPPGWESLEAIASAVASCTGCGLHKGRTNTVPGEGNPKPDVMFVGEAPGADEDAQGRPFVGRAGKLLTKMIEAMGFKREEVFIANICKCRPPNNRKPEPDEMEACIPYLKAQIGLLKPRVIVCLGATATEGLLGLSGISQLRGTWHTFEGIDVMPTFHPSYLLRKQSAKHDVWADLKAVLKHIGRPVPKR